PTSVTRTVIGGLKPPPFRVFRWPAAISAASEYRTVSPAPKKPPRAWPSILKWSKKEKQVMTNHISTPDLREQGRAKDGSPIFSNHRLWMQFLAFGDCRETGP